MLKCLVIWQRTDFLLENVIQMYYTLLDIKSFYVNTIFGLSKKLEGFDNIFKAHATNLFCYTCMKKCCRVEWYEHHVKINFQAEFIIST